MTNFNTLPIEDLYESTLQTDLQTSGTGSLTAKTVKLITGTLTGGATCYMGINYDKPSKYELVEISAISGQDVTIATRAVQTKAGGSATAQFHPAGSKVIITHSYKVFEDIATAVNSKADKGPALDGSEAVYADDTARDAAVTSPQNGQIVTTAGVLQYYSGGIWNDLGVGTPTPNASDTVAGKVEIATQSELNAGTDTGSTGALLSPLPSNLAIVAQQNKYTYAGTTGGTSTAYTATVTPAPSAYAAGQGFTVLIDQTNGASPTINFNGLGDKSIVDAGGSAIASGILPSGALVDLKYNGISFQAMNISLSKIPVVTTYQLSTQFLGDFSTQFDITNPSGTTFRYTWDGTGTNPGISSTTVPVGTVLEVYIGGSSADNRGRFTVTNSGTNFFEVTNASGVAETNKTISNGLLAYRTRPYTWTKAAGLRYVEVETLGGGGGTAELASSLNATGGGGGGGYAKKQIAASALGATETVTLGCGGIRGDDSSPKIVQTSGGDSSFGSLVSATGGRAGGNESASTSLGGAGGIGSNGDINVAGSDGGYSYANGDTVGKGGGSFYGGEVGIGTGKDGVQYGSGACGRQVAGDGNSGGNGLVIVTEYY